MKTHKLFESGSHTWLMFGRDNEKPDQIIDTNQYLVITKNNALLMDPGGIELFFCHAICSDKTSTSG